MDLLWKIHPSCGFREWNRYLFSFGMTFKIVGSLRRESHSTHDVTRESKKPGIRRTEPCDRRRRNSSSLVATTPFVTATPTGPSSAKISPERRLHRRGKRVNAELIPPLGRCASSFAVWASKYWQPAEPQSTHHQPL